MDARPQSLDLLSLEDRSVPAAGLIAQATSLDAPTITGGVTSTAPSLREFLGSTKTGTGTATAGNVAPLGANQYVVGAAAGQNPTVRVYDRTTGAEVGRILAYDVGFTGGVTVATGDVTADGVPDIVTAPGVGGSGHIKIYDGVTFTLVAEFQAYGADFRGGASVAVADVNGDKAADIITGAGPGGGSHVEVFDGRTRQVIRSAFAFDPSFTGGVTVAAGDVNGDGTPDIIAGAGAGGGPRVRAFSGTDFRTLLDFFATDVSYSGGVNVAAGAVGNGTGVNIVTATADAGGPVVRTFDGLTGILRDQFTAYLSNTPVNARVTVGDYTGDGIPDTAVVPAAGGPSLLRIIAKGPLEVARFEIPNPTLA